MQRYARHDTEREASQRSEDAHCAGGNVQRHGALGRQHRDRALGVGAHEPQRHAHEHNQQATHRQAIRKHIRLYTHTHKHGSR